MILARLLDPVDFGLLGMVTAFTGVLSLFRDFGLSAASIQRTDVTEDQASTLFWINALVGLILAAITLAFAPAISRFYHEPRLYAVTSVAAIGFLVNGISVQHSAILQRQMRFTTLGSIDVVALVCSSAIAIGAAMAGYGLWALVTTTVSLPLFTTCGLWFTAAWIPGMPHRRAGLRSMMRFGGTLTLNSLVMYLASNGEKVLLGRFWGADALGIYGRAYQLIRIPIDNLNSTVGDVAFSALSRIQDDPGRLRNYFLKGYSLFLALTVPITVSCALFANDTVLILLGPKWKAVASIFRLLAPTMLVFAISNPLGWLLTSIGKVGRGLMITLVLAPMMIVSYVLGLSYGPKGVAFAYSAVMTLWLIPGVLWCIHRTVISFKDIVSTVGRPLISIIPAAGLGFAAVLLVGARIPPLARLATGNAILFISYFSVLLFATGQRRFYVDLFRGMTAPVPKERNPASVS